MMTISVLMSVYKSETAANLQRALDSVWTKQTRKPNQIILIQDGRLPSDLVEVIKTWRNQLGDIFISPEREENKGLTVSLNEGLSYVKCDLIARMDTDDISDSFRFERQMMYLEAHPDVDIVGGSIREFNDTISELRIRHYPLTHDEALKYICKASPLAHPTVMMRRKMFDAGLMYNEKYKMSQDIALWFDAIQAGYRLGNVSEITLNFRSQGDVFKRRSRAKAWNEFCIYMSGIYRMNGLLTMKYIYPIARLCMRLMPPSVVKSIYGSSIRSKLLEKH